jgi:hypothetical protein
MANEKALSQPLISTLLYLLVHPVSCNLSNYRN